MAVVDRLFLLKWITICFLQCEKIQSQIPSSGQDFGIISLISVKHKFRWKVNHEYSSKPEGKIIDGFN